MKYLIACFMVFIFSLKSYSQSYSDTTKWKIGIEVAPGIHSIISFYQPIIKESTSLDGIASYSMTIVPGINHRQLFTGVGTGILIDNYPKISFPIFAEARYSFSKQDIHPIISIQLGYTIAPINYQVPDNVNITNSSYNGGIMASLAAGIEIYPVSFQIGYRFQGMTYNETSQYSAEPKRQSYNFSTSEIMFKVGYIFN